MSPSALSAAASRPHAMNHHKYIAIAHRDHDYCNPLSAAKFERLLDLLPLEATSRVLDLGCGRAELALRIIERFGSTVIALDHSPYMLDAARERAEWTGALGRLHLDDTDIRDFRADPETFHLSVMLEAGGIAGGMAGICRQLRVWTRAGGYVLVGIDYWKKKPPGELVALLPLGRAPRTRAAGRPRRPRDARPRAALARRLPQMGPRGAGLRRLPLLPTRIAGRLMAAVAPAAVVTRDRRDR